MSIPTIKDTYEFDQMARWLFLVYLDINLQQFQFAQYQRKF